MMRALGTALALSFAFCAAMPATADEEKLSKEQIEMIDKLLASMRCEVTGEIEVEDDEIELDDVICAGGQFDIELNKDLHIVGARPE